MESGFESERLFSQQMCGDFDTTHSDKLLDCSQDCSQCHVSECYFECCLIRDAVHDQRVCEILPWETSHQDEMKCSSTTELKKPRRANREASRQKPESKTDGSKKVFVKERYDFKHFVDPGDYIEDYRRNYSVTSSRQSEPGTVSPPAKEQLPDPYKSRLKALIGEFLAESSCECNSPRTAKPSRNKTIPYASASQSPTTRACTVSPSSSNPHSARHPATGVQSPQSASCLRLPTMNRHNQISIGDELLVSSLRTGRNLNSKTSGAAKLEGEQKKRSSLPKENEGSAMKQSPSPSAVRQINLTPTVCGFAPSYSPIRNDNISKKSEEQALHQNKTFNQSNPYLDLYTPKSILAAMKQHLYADSKEKSSGKRRKGCKRYCTLRARLPSNQVSFFHGSVQAACSTSGDQWDVVHQRKQNSLALTVNPIATLKSEII